MTETNPIHIVIIMRGGVIDAVRSDAPVNVDVIDHDDLSEEQSDLAEAEVRSKYPLAVL